MSVVVNNKKKCDCLLEKEILIEAQEFINILWFTAMYGERNFTPMYANFFLYLKEGLKFSLNKLFQTKSELTASV